MLSAATHQPSHSIASSPSLLTAHQSGDELPTLARQVLEAAAVTLSGALMTTKAEALKLMASWAAGQ